MRLLDRYLLRELLAPLGYCLSGFLLIWISADLSNNLHDFQEKRLGAADIANYYRVITPEFLITVLPIALLLALLYTLTNHARHNEITAIRAAGISLWRLCLPYLGVGLAASLLLLVVNEFWVPDSADKAEQIRNRHIASPGGAEPGRGQVRNLGFSNDSEQRQWLIGLYNTLTAEMSHPKVKMKQPDGSWLWLESDHAARSNGVWTFTGHVTLHRESGRPDEPLVPLLQTNLMAMPQFSETPEQIASEIKISSALSPGRGARRADIPIVDLLNYLRLHPDLDAKKKPWLYTKLQGRLAAPWTCLVVVLIAIPFGAASGRRNAFVGVASSIVICFAFFVVQTLALMFGASGNLPSWLAAWSPNVSFGIAGVWLTARVK
jgi:lipopolysaccharide export system permease protein